MRKKNIKQITTVDIHANRTDFSEYNHWRQSLQINCTFSIPMLYH